MLGTRKRSSPPLFNDNSNNGLTSNSNTNNNNSNNSYISPPSPLSPKQTNQFLFSNGLDYNNNMNNNGFTSYQPQTTTTTTSFINSRLNQFSLVSDSEQQASSSTSSSPTSPSLLLPPLNQQIYQYIDENDNSNLNNNSNNNNNNKLNNNSNSNTVINKSNIKKISNNKKQQQKVKRHINFKLDDDIEQQNSFPQDQNSNGNQEDEFYEANTDFGYLNVSSKEDLLVCLNVLKKEMGQFKNLSQNLLSRLQVLERGISQEKQVRLNGNSSGGHSRNNSDQDSFEGNYINNSSSPIFLASNSSSNNNNSSNNSAAIIQQEILISTCLLEIQKIIEKQRTYDSLLAQREKYWDIELNKLTMQILNKLNNGQHPNENHLNHHHLNHYLHNNQHHLLNSPNSTELQTFHHDQELYLNNSNNNEEIFDSYTALNSINNSIIRNNSSSNLSESNSNNNQIVNNNNSNNSLKNRLYNSFNRVYIYLFGTKKTITFWKKVLIISIIVILWPLVANLVYKLIMYIINKRRLSKQIINNNINSSSNGGISKLSSTLKPLKSTSLNNSNITGSVSGVSSINNNISSLISSNSNNNNNNGNNPNNLNNPNNVFKKIKSSILSNKKGGDLLNSNGNNGQIRAPDIVKAFIQGVSTGDGGSNDNLTNNTLTSLTNTLGNLNPSLVGGNNSSNSNNSVVSNTSSLLSNGLNSLTSSSLSPSSSSLPSSNSTSLASIIPNSTNIDNTTATNAIRNSLNRVRSLNNSNSNSNNSSTFSHNDGPEIADEKLPSYWQYSFVNGDCVISFRPKICNTNDVFTAKLETLIPSEGVYSLMTRLNIKENQAKMDANLAAVKKAIKSDTDWTIDQTSLEQVYPHVATDLKNSFGYIFAGVVEKVAANLAKRCADEMVLEAVQEVTDKHTIVFKHNPTQSGYWLWSFESGYLVISFKSIININDIQTFDFIKLL